MNFIHLVSYSFLYNRLVARFCQDPEGSSEQPSDKKPDRYTKSSLTSKSSLLTCILSPLLSGKILANISLHEETHEAVFRSGWVGILAAWKQDPNLLVTLPTTKALCNLDQKYGDVYMPGVYLLMPEHRSVRHLNELSNWGVDVVFIHGILGML